MDASIFALAAQRVHELESLPTTAAPESIDRALKALPTSLPETGLGTEATIGYVLNEIVPGLATGQAGPRYFGFVTGGVLPAAQLGDFITTIYDQNVQVHLPEETISTTVEARTLEMVLDLLQLPTETFTGRTLTTGATASNILGLVCGREHAIRYALANPDHSVAEDGWGGAELCVLADRPHASLIKAASVAGIGRSNVIDLAPNLSTPFRLADLEAKLRQCGPNKKRGAIVAISFAEVNTGHFTPGVSEIRKLCDRFGAWLHIDAGSYVTIGVGAAHTIIAFGSFANLSGAHPNVAAELALADSITSDAHKWLNVPYDCGIFFCRSMKHLKSILGPSPRQPPPAYLTPHSSATNGTTPSIVSPLHLNLENSRRFRALPLFCALLALGRQGYTELVQRNINFANKVAWWMTEGEGKQWYTVLNLLPQTPEVSHDIRAAIIPLNIVLFRAAPHCAVRAYTTVSSAPGTVSGTTLLVKAINDTRKLYVSPGNAPGGGDAARMAVSNWMTGRSQTVDDYEIVIGTLKDIMVNPPEWLKQYEQ